MASVNNPEATTTQAAPTVPAVSTELRLGNQTFEVRGLSTANGLAIYNALPAESQQRAQNTAGVVSSYHAIVTVAMRYGSDPTELALEWIRTRRADGSVDRALEGTTRQSREALRALDGVMSSAGIGRDRLIDMVPGGREAANLAGGTAAVAGGVGTGIAIGGAGLDGAVNGAQRVWGMLRTSGTELWESVTTNGNGIDPDAALSFGAVVEGLRYQQHAERNNLPMFAIGRPSQFFGNMMEYGSAGFQLLGSILAQHIPGASYAITAARFLFDNPERKSWSELQTEVRADIQTSRTENAVDLNPFSARNRERFSELADGAMAEKENAHARDVLLAAGEVAGIQTAGLADVATARDVTYRNQDGEDIRLTAGEAEVVGTRGSRVMATVDAIRGDGSVMEQTARVLGTTAVVGGLGTAAVVGAAAVPGMVGTAIVAGRETYQRQPLLRGMAYEDAAESNRATGQRRLLDPRTWFNRESVSEGAERRATFRDGQAATEYRVTAERADLQPDQVRGRADAHRAFAPERVGFREGMGNFFRNPFRSTAEAVGGLFGRGADGADRAVRGTGADLRMIGNDARGIISGVNPGFAESSRGVTRIASFSRFVPRGFGIFGTAVGAIGDTAEGVEAAQHGDGRGVARAGGRVVGGAAGGIAGGAAAGAAAGAAIGVWFGGIGAIPAALIGGAVGCVGAGIGAWAGSSAGGAVSEAALGGVADSVMGTQRDARGQVISRDGAAGRADEGLVAAAVDRAGGRVAFARSDVEHVGNVRTNEDGSLPTPGRPEMREQRAERPRVIVS